LPARSLPRRALRLIFAEKILKRFLAEARRGKGRKGENKRILERCLAPFLFCLFHHLKKSRGFRPRFN